MTIQYPRGTVITLNRSQIVRLTVLGAFIEPYSVTVPLNDSTKTVTFDATSPMTIDAIAAGLVAALEQEQTLYAASVDTPPWSLLLAGFPGVPFVASVTPNLQVDFVQASVKGSRERPVFVLASEELWTRAGHVERIVGRESESGEPFTFEGVEVMGVLQVAG